MKGPVYHFEHIKYIITDIAGGGVGTGDPF